MKQALEMALAKVQEFKSLWWKVPPFEKKVNKATREALIFAHNPIFEIEHLIKEALAQPEQEPVVWAEKVGGIGFKEPMPNANYKVIATIAPQRKPLTDEQIDGIASKFYPRSYGLDEFARAIEAAHGIKE